MSDPLLSLSNLSFSYDEDSPVLRGVSFDVEAGSYVTIIGHNGSGKSTLAKVIVGLLPRFQGDVVFQGRPLNRANLPYIRSHVGIVFQNPDNQFVGSTVADDIAFGLENRQVPTEDMDGIIHSFASEVGMEDFLDHEPQNLSGGQKQRVAIAGVLAMKPDLILFDEATAMLDPRGKREIRDLIAKMRQENPSIALVSITHDLEEAFASDKVIVLDQGKVLSQGSPREVFAHREELQSIHLGVPFFVEVVDALRKKGVEIPDSVQNLPALEDYLCR